jgi:hypothetical protein
LCGGEDRDGLIDMGGEELGQLISCLLTVERRECRTDIGLVGE